MLRISPLTIRPRILRRIGVGLTLATSTVVIFTGTAGQTKGLIADVSNNTSSVQRAIASPDGRAVDRSTRTISALTQVADTQPTTNDDGGVAAGAPIWDFNPAAATVWNAHTFAQLSRECFGLPVMCAKETGGPFDPPIDFGNPAPRPPHPGLTSRAFSYSACGSHIFECPLFAEGKSNVRVSGIGENIIYVVWQSRSYTVHHPWDCPCDPNIYFAHAFAHVDSTVPLNVIDRNGNPWPFDITAEYTAVLLAFNKPDPEAPGIPDDDAETEGETWLDGVSLFGLTSLPGGNYDYTWHADVTSGTLSIPAGGSTVIDVVGDTFAFINPPPVLPVVMKDRAMGEYWGMIEIRLPTGPDGGGPVPPSCCPAVGSCHAVHPNPGCDDTACCMMVSQVDPYCCTNDWDSICVQWAGLLCPAGSSATSSMSVLGTCGRYSPNDCFTPVPPGGPPGCNDPSCCSKVCAVKPECCTNEWDSECVDIAWLRCFGDCTGNCGGQGGAQCYCDNVCHIFGDCCPNACTECPLLPGCPQPAQPCPWDLNGDQVVNGFDLLDLLACWGATNPPCAAADFNGDGAVNGFDLLELLANWGPCP